MKKETLSGIKNYIYNSFLLGFIGLSILIPQWFLINSISIYFIIPYIISGLFIPSIAEKIDNMIKKNINTVFQHNIQLTEAIVFLIGFYEVAIFTYLLTKRKLNKVRYEMIESIRELENKHGGK